MNKPPRVTQFSLGAEPTLDTLRELLETTEKLDGSARIEFGLTRGQRDQTYVLLKIVETDW